MSYVIPCFAYPGSFEDPCHKIAKLGSAMDGFETALYGRSCGQYFHQLLAVRKTIFRSAKVVSLVKRQITLLSSLENICSPIFHCAKINP